MTNIKKTSALAAITFCFLGCVNAENGKNPNYFCDSSPIGFSTSPKITEKHHRQYIEFQLKFNDADNLQDVSWAFLSTSHMSAQGKPKKTELGWWDKKDTSKVYVRYPIKMYDRHMPYKLHQLFNFDNGCRESVGPLLVEKNELGKFTIKNLNKIVKQSFQK